MAMSQMPPFMSFSPLEEADLKPNTAGMSNFLIPKIHAHHPDGALDLSQRLRLTAHLLAARWMRKRPRRRHMSEPRSEFENPKLWKAIEVPSGRMAERAWTLAREHQPGWLINHCLRTHVWGQAFGVIGGLCPKREELFAAAMLHDAGLTPIAATSPRQCFAIRGADYARRGLDGMADPDTLNVVVEAIARHLDFEVGVRDGVEAHLLQAGAMADVVGRNLHRVPQAVRQHALSAHPRMRMKDELCRCMVSESAAAPHSRMACYVKHIDFVNLIRQAPFEE